MADKLIYLYGRDDNGVQTTVPTLYHDNGDGTYSQTVVGATGGLGTLSAGEAHLGSVGGHILVPSQSITRPNDTTPYSIGDLVGNSTTAGSVIYTGLTVVRTGGELSGSIRRVRVKKSGAVLTNASFRVHFNKVTPTFANGDNAAWSTNQAANYLGAFDVTMDRAFTDGAHGTGVPLNGSEISFKLASGTTISWSLEARAAYTPAAQEIFTVEPEVLAN